MDQFVRWMKDLEYKSGGYLPPVVFLFIAANLLIFLLDILSTGMMTNLFILSPEAVFGGQIWRLVTHAFVHADILHLFFNMLVFFFVANIMVRFGGVNHFVIMIFSAILLSSIVHIFAYPGVGALGFSAAVYAVLVTFAMINPRATILIFFVIPAPAWLVVTGLILLGIFGAFSPNDDGIGHLAHLLGALVGFLFVYYERPIKQLYEGYLKGGNRRSSSDRDFSGSNDSDYSSQNRNINEKQELDRILDKVGRSGIHTLTDQERKFLEDYRNKHL